MSKKESKKAEQTSMKSDKDKQTDESDNKRPHKITQMDLDMEEPE